MLFKKESIGKVTYFPIPISLIMFIPLPLILIYFLGSQMKDQQPMGSIMLLALLAMLAALLYACGGEMLPITIHKTKRYVSKGGFKAYADKIKETHILEDISYHRGRTRFVKHTRYDLIITLEDGTPKCLTKLSCSKEKEEMILADLVKYLGIKAEGFRTLNETAENVIALTNFVGLGNKSPEPDQRNGIESSSPVKTEESVSWYPAVALLIAFIGAWIGGFGIILAILACGIVILPVGQKRTGFHKFAVFLCIVLVCISFLGGLPRVISLVDAMLPK